MEYRTGIGYDVHQLTEGRKLVLGGVTIPYHKGLLGHSDADVIIHAVMDAMIGAAGLGDIGQHFPDTDARFKGISSLALLAETRRLLEDKGYDVSNIDVVLLAEEPKISPFKSAMKQNMAQALSISQDFVNIKATTNEGLGFVGEKKGMAAYATVLIRRR